MQTIATIGLNIARNPAFWCTASQLIAARPGGHSPPVEASVRSGVLSLFRSYLHAWHRGLRVI